MIVPVASAIQIITGRAFATSRNLASLARSSSSARLRSVMSTPDETMSSTSPLVVEERRVRPGDQPPRAVAEDPVVLVLGREVAGPDPVEREADGLGLGGIDDASPTAGG